MAKEKFQQDTLAVVYDFDGTLTKRPMQEYTVLPKIKVKGADFWKESNLEAKKHKADEMLTYMRLLIEKFNETHIPFKRDELVKLGAKIPYYKGVETWFDRLNNYVKDVSGGSVKVKHYIISAGLKEILDGVSIKKHFQRVYASEYFFNHNGIATFPKVVITDTTKTQYLFRINKGRECQNDDINSYMPEEQRPIPFDNMIYIGDGLTDVPCMKVTRQGGGHAVAVYSPRDSLAKAKCQQLQKAGRIDCYANADYREGRVLEQQVQGLAKLVVAKVQHAKRVFKCDNDAKNA